jgi:hypothetical protein
LKYASDGWRREKQVSLNHEDGRSIQEDGSISSRQILRLESFSTNTKRSGVEQNRGEV